MAKEFRSKKELKKPKKDKDAKSKRPPAYMEKYNTYVSPSLTKINGNP